MTVIKLTPVGRREEYFADEVESLQAENERLRDELELERVATPSYERLQAEGNAQLSLLREIRDQLLNNDGRLGVDLWQELCRAADESESTGDTGNE